jgi:hypothetical protein
VLEGHDHHDDETGQHKDAAEQERPDIAPQAPDLGAASSDGLASLAGAGEVPYQESGNNRDKDGHGKKPICGKGPDTSSSPYILRHVNNQLRCVIR